MNVLSASQICNQLISTVGSDLSLFTKDSYTAIAAQAFGHLKQPRFPSSELGEDPSPDERVQILMGRDPRAFAALHAAQRLNTGSSWLDMAIALVALWQLHYASRCAWNILLHQIGSSAGRGREHGGLCTGAGRPPSVRWRSHQRAG
jgi:hypothetical protein